MLASTPEDTSVQTGDGRFAPEDIEQGQLGDCWLISAMSLLALRDAEGRGGLEKVFVTRDTAADGRYECRLYSSAAGCWRRVVIDDRLPAKRRGGQPAKTASKVLIWWPESAQASASNARKWSGEWGRHRAGVACQRAGPGHKGSARTRYPAGTMCAMAVSTHVWKGSAPF